MTGSELALLALSGVAALCLNLGEAVGATGLPPAAARSMALRRWPLRAAALGGLAVTLQRLLSHLAGVLFSHLDACLLRSPVPPPSEPWTALGAALWVLVALLGCRLVLPAPVTAALSLALAWATLVVVPLTLLLPLTSAAARQLLGVVAPLTLAGWLLARAAWGALLRRAEPTERARLQRCLTAGRRLLVCLTVPGLVALRPGLVGGALPALVALVAVSVGLAWLARCLEPPLDRGAPGRFALDTLLLRPRAWAALAILVCVLHGAVSLVGLSVVLGRGRAVQARVTRWPQVMIGSPEPTPAAWVAAGERLKIVTRAYDGHPWCAQWLVLLAWIESSRLHHAYTATMLLEQARERYPRVRVTPPPGWHTGRDLEELAARMRAEWGRLIEPGAEPG